MSTRSYIGKMINNSVRSIYCRHGGYPEGVGQTLLNHYGEKELDKLLDLGGISSLQDTIESTAVMAIPLERSLAKSSSQTKNKVESGIIAYIIVI